MDVTYILRCGDGSLYTGWTNDLNKRVDNHQKGRGAKYTASHLPVSLVYYEEHISRKAAQRREWQIKQLGKQQKENLIAEPKNYSLALFDLDGTIIDSGLGITNAAAYALKKMNRPVLSRRKLFCFVGPPLTDSFQKFCAMTPEESDIAVKAYREYYRETGIHENTVYPGIEELLKDLKKAGITIMLATSKPEIFAKAILTELGLASYFDVIAGAEEDKFGTERDKWRSKKSDVIAYGLDLLHRTDKEHMIMIGDRHYDVKGAQEMGIDSIGVTFGYGSRLELQDAGATYIARDAEEIKEIILSKRNCIK